MGLRLQMTIVACSIMLSAGSATAQTDSEFFKDRQITLLIGGGAGGSIDIFGRLFAKHVTKHLPGNANVVSKNLPSAGGVQAYMQLGTTAARDGSVIAMAARGPLTDPLFGDKPATYDVRKFNWLGSLSDDSTVCFTSSASRIGSLADAQKYETTMASTGALSESAKFPLVLNATLGTKFKVITGYSGAADTVLAVERGETDGRCTTFGSLFATQPKAMESGAIKLLVQLGLEKHKSAPDVPLSLDLATNEADRTLQRLIIAPLAITAAFALPPETSTARLSVWRNAFEKTARDPEFLRSAAQANLEIVAKAGNEVEQFVHDLYNTPAAVVKRAHSVFAEKR